MKTLLTIGLLAIALTACSKGPDPESFTDPTNRVRPINNPR